MKKCNKCQIEKDFIEFCKRKKSNDGFQYVCKSCKYQDRVNYRAANKEVVSLKDAKRYEKNSEKIKLLRRIRHAKNPSIGLFYWRKRRALKLKSEGSLSKGLVKTLFKLQKGKCPCCGFPLGKNFHMDHKIPLSRGGSNSDENMQLLRKKCNQQKGAKDPIDFMQSRGFLI